MCDDNISCCMLVGFHQNTSNSFLTFLVFYPSIAFDSIKHVMNLDSTRPAIKILLVPTAKDITPLSKTLNFAKLSLALMLTRFGLMLSLP